MVLSEQVSLTRTSDRSGARAAPPVKLRHKLVPERERVTLLRETVLENRTVELRDRRIAVNPGIAPAFEPASTRPRNWTRRSSASRRL